MQKNPPNRFITPKRAAIIITMLLALAGLSTFFIIDRLKSNSKKDDELQMKQAHDIPVGQATGSNSLSSSSYDSTISTINAFTLREGFYCMLNTRKNKYLAVSSDNAVINYVDTCTTKAQWNITITNNLFYLIKNQASNKYIVYDDLQVATLSTSTTNALFQILQKDQLSNNFCISNPGHTGFLGITNYGVEYHRYCTEAEEWKFTEVVGTTLSQNSYLVTPPSDQLCIRITSPIAADAYLGYDMNVISTYPTCDHIFTRWHFVKVDNRFVILKHNATVKYLTIQDSKLTLTESPAQATVVLTKQKFTNNRYILASKTYDAIINYRTNLGVYLDKVANTDFLWEFITTTATSVKSPIPFLLRIRTSVTEGITYCILNNKNKYLAVSSDDALTYTDNCNSDASLWVFSKDVTQRYLRNVKTKKYVSDTILTSSTPSPVTLDSNTDSVCIKNSIGRYLDISFTFQTICDVPQSHKFIEFDPNLNIFGPARLSNGFSYHELYGLSKSLSTDDSAKARFIVVFQSNKFYLQNVFTNTYLTWITSTSSFGLTSSMATSATLNGEKIISSSGFDTGVKISGFSFASSYSLQLINNKFFCLRNSFTQKYLGWRESDSSFFAADSCDDNTNEVKWKYTDDLTQRYTMFHYINFYLSPDNRNDGITPIIKSQYAKTYCIRTSQNSLDSFFSMNPDGTRTTTTKCGQDAEWTFVELAGDVNQPHSLYPIENVYDLRFDYYYCINSGSKYLSISGASTLITINNCDDQRSHWLISNTGDQILFKNRATGHYLRFESNSLNINTASPSLDQRVLFSKTSEHSSNYFLSNSEFEFFLTFDGVSGVSTSTTKISFNVSPAIQKLNSIPKTNQPFCIKGSQGYVYRHYRQDANQISFPRTGGDCNWLGSQWNYINNVLTTVGNTSIAATTALFVFSRSEQKFVANMEVDLSSPFFYKMGSSGWGSGIDDEKKFEIHSLISPTSDFTDPAPISFPFLNTPTCLKNEFGSYLASFGPFFHLSSTCSNPNHIWNINISPDNFYYNIRSSTPFTYLKNNGPLRTLDITKSPSNSDAFNVFGSDNILTPDFNKMINVNNMNPTTAINKWTVVTPPNQQTPSQTYTEMLVDVNDIRTDYEETYCIISLNSLLSLNSMDFINSMTLVAETLNSQDINTPYVYSAFCSEKNRWSLKRTDNQVYFKNNAIGTFLKADTQTLDISLQLNNVSSPPSTSDVGFCFSRNGIFLSEGTGTISSANSCGRKERWLLYKYNS